jgi:hypothetical protein
LLVCIAFVYYIIDGYEQEANEAATKAMAAEQLAKEASSRIQAVRDKLPQDRQKAQEIPAMIADVNKGIDDAKRQGNTQLGILH